MLLNSRPIVKRILYLCAWAASLALLVVLRLENASVHVALVALLAVGFWFAAFKIRDWAPGAVLDLPPTDSGDESLMAQAHGTLVERYYVRLMDSLEQNWQLLELDLDQAQMTLRNVHHALVDAVDTAHSTGMLALNSMVTAAGTGEVGRGFITVSRDLVAISEKSGRDLQQMKDVVARTESKLVKARGLLSSPAPFVSAGQQDSSISELDSVVACACNAQEELRVIADRYRRNSQSDVRWLQLGEAVRRLVNEVINILYQFELRLSDVISDLRLVCLAGALPKQQLLEFQSRFDSKSGSKGLQ